MVELFRSFTRLKPVTVLVVGDFMLDVYTLGEVKRVSPEAPVSVLKVKEEKNLPGGAGNVVLNLASLGAKVIPFGRIGQDLQGKALKQALQQEGIDTSCLFEETFYKTPVKNRFIASSQQVLRVDWEEATPYSKEKEAVLLQKLFPLLERVQIVAISDYQKGLLTPSFLQALIQKASQRKIPVVVDPKGKDFTKYQGAYLIKPNQTEAIEASPLSEESSFEQICSALLQKTKVKHLLVTRSEKGISWLSASSSEVVHFPAQAKEVKDVTGAGDTVLAVICLALANRLTITEAASLANMAASIAIERVGCVRVALSDLAKKMVQTDTSIKIFEETQLRALTEMLRKKPFSVVSLSSEKGISSFLLEQLFVRQQKEKIVIYIQEEKLSKGLTQFVSVLQSAGFVFLQKKGLKKLLEALRPRKLFLGRAKKLEEVSLEAFFKAG